MCVCIQFLFPYRLLQNMKICGLEVGKNKQKMKNKKVVRERDPGAFQLRIHFIDLG